MRYLPVVLLALVLNYFFMPTLSVNFSAAYFISIILLTLLAISFFANDTVRILVSHCGPGSGGIKEWNYGVLFDTERR